MEKSMKLQILENIGKVYEQAKGCKLENSFFEKIDNELSQLIGYFKTTKNQSFIIAMVFALNYKGDTVDLNDLIEYLDCNPMKLLEYSDDFEYLYSKGIFGKQKSGHRIKLAGANDQFIFNEKISEAILQNKSLPETVQEKQINDVLGFLEELYSFGQQRDDEEVSTIHLFANARMLIFANLHFPLVKWIDQCNFSISDIILYCYLVWKTLSGKESVDIARALEGIFDNPVERITSLQSFQSGNNQLVKNNLVETIESSFLNDTEIKLTDKSVKVLKDCGINLFIKKKESSNILLSDRIYYKKLFYNENELQQLSLLKDLLQETKFLETQTRLEGKGLPKGVTVLLHGAPGTGKTETAKQLAKETGRELMKVEISQSKSMWFGESEKIIKRIFTDYRSYSKESDRMPILLFNEADAIISKRKTDGRSSVDQTENAIQNILLEELENFEGILIATTNLVQNIDRAFDRRFLFKIEFHKPDVVAKSKIWKDKLPHLAGNECNALATQFDFSGGQIDNIVRKNEIHEIIYGKKVNFNSILQFCEEEVLGNAKVKIGFNKE